MPEPKENPEGRLVGDVWVAIVAAAVALSEAIGYLAGEEEASSLVSQLTDARDGLTALIERR